MGKLIEVNPGDTIGYWTIIKQTRKDSKSNRYFLCECICGTTKEVRLDHMRSGNSLQCGCKNIGNLQHGLSHTREWNTWQSMISRCKNDREWNSNWYGRGIKVCRKWRLSFLSFYEDMGKKPSSKHSIDRIDNNGDYCKENCRWATQKEQARNTRVNKFLSLNNETKTIADWSECTSLKYSTIQRRIDLCWPTDKILTTPTRPHKPYANAR